MQTNYIASLDALLKGFGQIKRDTDISIIAHHQVFGKKGIHTITGNDMESVINSAKGIKHSLQALSPNSRPRFGDSSQSEAGRIRVEVIYEMAGV